MSEKHPNEEGRRHTRAPSLSIGTISAGLVSAGSLGIIHVTESDRNGVPIKGQLVREIRRGASTERSPAEIVRELKLRNYLILAGPDPQESSVPTPPVASGGKPSGSEDQVRTKIPRGRPDSPRKRGSR